MRCQPCRSPRITIPMKYIFLFAGLFAAMFSFGQTPIDTTEEISIGGIRQVITIESKDTDLPILLFLHGGPGGSVMGYSDKFTNKLKEHFIVVQWDQRETGRTLHVNPSPIRLSLELFHHDTHEIILTLLKRFNREKLYLAGHSWGTSLGFHIARQYPSLLYAYIAIGPMVNQVESESIALSLMKERAQKKGNQQAVGELARVKIPFENGEQLYYHRKWLQELAGSRRTLSRQYVEDWAARWLPVFAEASSENLFETSRALGCPVYFVAGKKDYQTNSQLAEKYYLVLTAPRKGFFWFDAGHSIPTSNPGMLQDRIIGTVLPETFTINKPATLITTQ